MSGLLIAQRPDYQRFLEPQPLGHALLLFDERHVARAVPVHRNDHGDAASGAVSFPLTLGFSEKIGVGALTAIDQGDAVKSRALGRRDLVVPKNGIRAMR
jgi:hypothetical protein